MSWRLYKPRRIGSHEIKIVRRVLLVGTESRPPKSLLDSVEFLIVREEGGNGSFLYDSLEFENAPHGSIIASAVGDMSNDAQVELYVWARGETLTCLEVEPFDGARLPVRLPILDSIRPYPEVPYGTDCENDVAVPAQRIFTFPGSTSRGQ